ncbi:hypothetical protein ACFVUS_39770 [Nocardia sp. NPDC058058]|uniref:hypothetical protein n=1 Tax=Nocardia sp. NPDC058058 TaxID=3346317 RepID=UPI0036D7E5E0
MTHTSRPRAIRRTLPLLATVAALGLIVGCSSDPTSGPITVKGSPAVTTVSAAPTTTTTGANPGAAQSGGGQQPGGAGPQQQPGGAPIDEPGPAPDPGTGTPLGTDHYVKCTDKINYAGDPRSNAEINLEGERHGGDCPAPITSSPTAAPSTVAATTTVAPPAVTTTVSPAPTTTAAATSAPAATEPATTSAAK